MQQLLRRLLGEEGRLKWVFDTASGAQQLDSDTFAGIRSALADVYQAMKDTHAEAKTLAAPALTNVPEGTRLFDLLAERTDGPLPRPPSGDSISGEWISGLASRLNQMLDRAKRVHFKSVGGLLAFQERLASEPRTRPEIEWLPTDDG